MLPLLEYKRFGFSVWYQYREMAANARCFPVFWNSGIIHDKEDSRSVDSIVWVS